MSFWRRIIFSKKRPSAISSDYLLSIFSFDFKQEEDSRDWRQIDELKDIPDIVNNLDPAIAEGVSDVFVGALLREYPDYDFAHCWHANLLKRIGKFNEARKAYKDGIPVSKQKYLLCSNLAELELDQGLIKETIKWCIRSVLFQLKSEKVMFPPVPFIFLSHIAEKLGEKEISNKIWVASWQSDYKSCSITEKAEKSFNIRLKKKDLKEIRQAIKQLTSHENWKGKVTALDLHRAIEESGRLYIISAIIDAGADVNAEMHRYGKDGITPLMVCAWNCHAEIAGLLLFHGANVNATDEYGWTALHFAALRGDLEMIALLHRNNAATDVVGKPNLTPKDVALKVQNDRAVDLFNWINFNGSADNFPSG